MIDLCQELDLEIKGVRLPEIEIPKKELEKAGIKKCSTGEFLKTISNKSLEEKIQSGKLENPEKYKERLDYELALFEEIGFTDYILLVWEVINYCATNGIPVGPGRGSAAGSLTLYLIGVTKIDPIKYGLYFERFVSKTRAKSTIIDGIRYIDGSLAPDVDLDICHFHRDRVIKYLEKKYSGRFCKLPTYASLKTKLLVKECSKILCNATEEDAQDLANMVPVKYGKNATLDETREASGPFNEYCNENSRFYEIANKLQGLIKNKSSHASAYLISYNELDDFMPCEISSTGDLTCSPDMEWAQMECIKLDLLGLQAITLINAITKRVGISEDDIDIEDFESIYANLQSLRYPYGLFQISGDANFRVTNKIAPKNLSELSAVVALARPGAIDYVADYVGDIEQNKKNLQYEVLQDVLKDTNYIPIYQEQMMQMAHKVFGLSLEESELLRRAAAKKKTKEMKEWEARVYEAAEEQNLSKDIADFFFKVLIDSSNYSFNLSHAAAYSFLSALTVYFKFNYPKEFFVEALKIAEEKPNPREDITLIQAEMEAFGISLLPPDLALSEASFSLEGDHIRYGLSSIKGISKGSLDNLNAFLRESPKNKFEMFQAAKNCGLNVGAVSALIQAGTCNSFISTYLDRPKFVLEAQLWSMLTDRERAYLITNGKNYNFNLFDALKDIPNWKKENGSAFTVATRLDTLRKRYDPYKNIFLKNNKNPLLAAYFYEKKLLGYSYSVQLKSAFDESKLSSISEIQTLSDGSTAYLVAEVDSIAIRKSKSGVRYISIIFSDESGFLKANMYGNKAEQYLAANKDLPKEGAIVSVSGQVSIDQDNMSRFLWLNTMASQSDKIYMSLAELKEDNGTTNI